MKIRVKSQESRVKSQRVKKSIIHGLIRLPTPDSRLPTLKYILLIILVLFVGCKKKEEVKPVEVRVEVPLPIEVEEPKHETYQYFDMGRRDPFISLRGVGIKNAREVEITIEEGTKTEESGMEGWAISGFIWDKKEKIAVITGSEENYLFAQEEILDKDGDKISEIKAKSKEDGILLTKNGKDIFLKMEEKKIKEENVIE